MMPTLLIGDFILVNKFAYGLRLPVTNKKFVAIGEPKRGDVVVFRPPHHPRRRTASSASSACRATPSPTATTPCS